jgi:hypothetical protein
MGSPGTMQAALYRNRRRRLARVLMQGITPWSSGLVVEAGQFVTVGNGNVLLLAQSSATTGAVEPAAPTYPDNVAWSVASAQQLLTFQFAPDGVPSP